MKRLLLTSWIAAACLSLISLGATAQPRVLSLDLCMDWMMAHYLPAEQVVALSPMQSHYPTDWIGPNWPQHGGSVEQIYQLKPDLILVGQYSASTLRQRLASLGLKVEVFTLPSTLQGLLEYQRHFLRSVGLDEKLADTLPPVREKPAKRQRLLLLGANGIGTGAGTLEDEILRYAGWDNYLTAPGYQALDLERIVADPPEAVLWAAPKNRALANRFAEHSALHKAIPAERWLSTDYWRWQCPGPWMWPLIGQLEQWLD